MNSRIVNVRSNLPFDFYAGRGRCPRTGAPSILGNPFGFRGGEAGISVRVGSRESAIKAYRDWLKGTAWQHVEPERRLQILTLLPHLKGKIGGCWCFPLPCHVEVILELAEEA